MNSTERAQLAKLLTRELSFLEVSKHLSKSKKIDIFSLRFFKCFNIKF